MGVSHIPFVLLRSSSNKSALPNIIIIVTHFVMAFKLEIQSGGLEGVELLQGGNARGPGFPPPRAKF
jgi:hypothetical protein